MHSGKTSFRVQHREFVADVSTSVGYAVTKYSVNPGLKSTFPWLGDIASAFEQYKLHGMVVELKSMSGSAVGSTNTALGTMGIVAQYNPLLPNFSNKQAAENAEGSVSSVPSCSIMMGIECAPKSMPTQQLYVRTGAVPAGTDQRLFDLCNFQVFTQGAQAASTAAELWITYDVELFHPILNNGEDLVGCAHFSLGAPTVAGPAYWGNTPANGTTQYNNLGIVLSGGNKITIPSGNNAKYILIYYVIGTGTAALVPPSRTFVNATTANVFSSTAAPVAQYFNNGPESGATALELVMCDAFTVADNSAEATITFSVGTLPTTTVRGDLLILRVPVDMV
jgi:hypothetical protein